MIKSLLILIYLFRMGFKDIPAVEFIVNSNGITIFSINHLKMPRFVQFDIPGKCQNCKSDAVEIDYVVQPNGVTIYCSRLKRECFVEFDYPRITRAGTTTFFRVKIKGKIFNIPFQEDQKREIEYPEIENKLIDPANGANNNVNLSEIPMPT